MGNHSKVAASDHDVIDKKYLFLFMLKMLPKNKSNIIQDGVQV